MCFVYRVFQIILAIVSWVSTSYGVLVVLHEGEFNFNSVLTDPISIIAVIILAILTFMAISWLNNILRKSTSLAKKTISLVAYLFYVTMSISFAYGFWWNFAIAKKDINTLIHRHLNKAQQNILNINFKVQGFHNQLSRLVRKANEKQQLEREKGGSCDNQNGDPIPGEGPYFNGRTGITERIELLRNSSVDLEEILNSLKVNLTSIVNQSKNDIKKSKQSELNEKISNFVNQYNNSIKQIQETDLNYRFPQIEELLNQIIDAVSLSSNSVLRSSGLQNNQNIRHCSDNDLSKQLTILKNNLLSVKSTLSQTQLNINVGEQSDRTKDALWGLYNNFVPESLKYKGNTYPISYFALSLGIVVDFLLLFITIILFSCGKNLEEDIKKLLENKYKKYKDSIYDVLTKCISSIDNKTYIICNNDNLIVNGTDIIEKIAKYVDEPQYIKEIPNSKKRDKILDSSKLSGKVYEINSEFKNILIRSLDSISTDEDDW